MWNTPRGTRILVDAEAVVLCNTIGELIDAIRAEQAQDEAAAVGIGLFDHLSWQQQLAMLLKVARPLLDQSIPAPEKSALMDATVAAIYAQMLIGVEYEIEMQQSSADSTDTDTIRRQEIVTALRQSTDDLDLPDPECVVIEEWELAIEILQDQVLFDEDFKMYDLAIDLPPDQATNLKAIAGIDSDYFVDIPPDPESPACVWADLIELTTGQRPDEAAF